MDIQLDDSPNLASLSQAQRIRLAYIEFRLYFLGEVRRVELIEQFDIGPAGATRDLALYKQLAPANLHFNGTTKRYIISEQFVPIFAHIPEYVLSSLTQGFGKGAYEDFGQLLSCEYPASLSKPSMETLSVVTRATFAKNALKIDYCSLSSSWGEREIVPHSLVNSGLRWHIRAFDRKSNEFRDFVITRIKNPKILNARPVASHERMESDKQWTRIVDLILAPHPTSKRPEIIERDYGMNHGVLQVEVRAALAGYMLRQWQVDCSPDYSLGQEGYQLCLKNPQALYGVRNLFLAPGYSN